MGDIFDDKVENSFFGTASVAGQKVQGSDAKITRRESGSRGNLGSIDIDSKKGGELITESFGAKGDAALIISSGTRFEGSAIVRKNEDGKLMGEVQKGAIINAQGNSVKLPHDDQAQRRLKFYIDAKQNM